jgi:hypothetical protein
LGGSYQELIRHLDRAFKTVATAFCLWNLRLSRRRVWRWLSSGLLRRVVWWKFTDVSEVLATSIIRAIIAAIRLHGPTHKSAICILFDCSNEEFHSLKSWHVLWNGMHALVTKNRNSIPCWSVNVYMNRPAEWNWVCQANSVTVVMAGLGGGKTKKKLGFIHSYCSWEVWGGEEIAL